MKRIMKFTLLAVAVLLLSVSCQKDDPKFWIFVQSILFQEVNPGTGEATFDLWFGVTGFNEELQTEAVNISHNGMPLMGISYIPNSYETVSNPTGNPTDFNGTYLFQAKSKNQSEDSISGSITLTNTPLTEFDIEDFSYNNYTISCKFKNIDEDAEVCGFYIIPLIDGLPEKSKIGDFHRFERNVLEETGYTVSIERPVQNGYNRVKIYPAIAKMNGYTMQILLGDALVIE